MGGSRNTQRGDENMKDHVLTERPWTCKHLTVRQLCQPLHQPIYRRLDSSYLMLKLLNPCSVFYIRSIGEKPGCFLARLSRRHWMICHVCSSHIHFLLGFWVTVLKSQRAVNLCWCSAIVSFCLLLLWLSYVFVLLTFHLSFVMHFLILILLL